LNLSIPLLVGRPHALKSGRPSPATSTRPNHLEAVADKQRLGEPRRCVCDTNQNNADFCADRVSALETGLADAGSVSFLHPIERLIATQTKRPPESLGQNISLLCDIYQRVAQIFVVNLQA
jgi:hypothetical protein